MNLLLAGINHKSGCPVPIRERLAALRALDVLRRLRKQGWGEAVVLSTCNRFEIYAADAGADALNNLSLFLESLAGQPLQGLIYRRAGLDAVRHLFSVAAGLDSLVLGENEILGQVKTAYETALGAGATAKLTNVLFQRALYVGKKVRTDTGISAGQLSVASVAVALAERIFATLRESSVLILGAGQMAESAARHLLSAKVAKLHIANHTWERGKELAERLRADAVRWDEFPRLLETVDVVIASTGAPQAVLTRDRVASAVRERKGRPLFLIDIAMPRDIEDAVEGLDSVYLYTLDDLQSIVEENKAQRRMEIASAESLVRSKAEEFASWLEAARRCVPAVLPDPKPSVCGGL